ncbi:MAG: MFS transporter [Chloroflexi bacterium]|nr:MFS transporter [Chloroflexota bacterium]
MTHLRTFYILVVTQGLSLIGSRMSSIAIGIRVFAETGDAAPLLLTAFFNELPAMLFSSAAGVLVDRWDRRRVMILADAGQAIGSLLLVASFLSGAFQLWHLYAVALLNGVFAMFQEPAKSATITMLIPDQQRDRANAIQSMLFPLAGVIAPALTGLLYGLIGIAGIIALDMLTFVVAVVVIYGLHIPRPAQSDEARASSGGFWRELAGGWRYLQSRPGLRVLVMYFTLMNFLLNGPLELSIPYLMTITRSETITGLVLAANSLGGFVGAGWLAARGARGSRSRIHTVMPAFLVVGLMFLVYGTTRSPLVLAVSIFVLIAALQTWALYTSILQVKTPPDMQGRIFAVVNQLGYLGATTSFLLTGPLVDNILEPAVGTSAWNTVAPIVGNQPGAGMGLVLVMTGVIIIALTVAVYAWPPVRRVETHLPSYTAAAAD